MSAGGAAGGDGRAGEAGNHDQPGLRLTVVAAGRLRLGRAGVRAHLRAGRAVAGDASSAPAASAAVRTEVSRVRIGRAPGVVVDAHTVAWPACTLIASR